MIDINKIVKYNERNVEKRLIDGCKKLGIETRKLKWVGRDGAPDRLVIHNGGIFVELKRPDGKLSPIQIRELGTLKRGGCKTTVLYTYEQVDEFLRGLKCAE